jgi:hypothetical protein
MKSQEKQLPKKFIILIKRENRGRLTHLKLVPYILGNGEEASEMALENRHGQMEQSILVNGKKTELMEKEDSFTLMEISMKGSGLMTKQMDLGFTSM